MADIPGTKSAWVSAIGVNHGYLAVQFAQPAGVDRSMNANRIQPYLLDAGGHIINGSGATGFKTDAQLNPIHTAQQGANDLTEAYFAVDTTMLDGYTLCFKGSVWNAISGEWNLNVNFDSLQHQAREVKADITVGKVQLKDVVIRINPFGMTLTGNGAPDVDYAAPMNAKTVLETTKGDIELKGETLVEPIRRALSKWSGTHLLLLIWIVLPPYVSGTTGSSLKNKVPLKIEAFRGIFVLLGNFYIPTITIGVT